MSKRLLSGGQALAEAAMRAGCRHYFGVDSTPPDQVAQYMAKHLPGVNGAWLASHDQAAAMSTAMGAAMAGARVLTSCTGPANSQMQEGLSYMAGLELPAVVAQFMRGGPGMGNIAPSQGDYFQATRGGGHGDYRSLVLAPASCQEMCDLTSEAFGLADHYRNPVVVLADSALGQIMEPVELPEPIEPASLPGKSWRLDGAANRPARSMESMRLLPKLLEEHNYKLVRKYDAMARSQTRWQEYYADDARLLVVAYGIAARIARAAVEKVRRMGLKVGILRPITLWPFPERHLKELTRVIRHVLVIELSTGQMKQDVELAIRDQATVHFHGRPGGAVPTPDEVAHQISHYYHQARLHGQAQGGAA